MAEVTVRYWASARAAAGLSEEVLVGGLVGDIVDAARASHPALAPVLEVATLLLDGRPVQVGDPLPAGGTLEVLPPFAGG